MPSVPPATNNPRNWRFSASMSARRRAPIAADRVIHIARRWRSINGRVPVERTLCIAYIPRVRAFYANGAVNQTPRSSIAREDRGKKMIARSLSRPLANRRSPRMAGAAVPRIRQNFADVTRTIRARPSVPSDICAMVGMKYVMGALKAQSIVNYAIRKRYLRRPTNALVTPLAAIRGDRQPKHDRAAAL